MSDLLNQASLVMVPSGYKEDTVYSVVPSDGSGDMAFTRASNGTRINSAGLVEVVAWNLLSYSEEFNNTSGWLVQNGASITANSTTAPNGTTTADTISYGTSSISACYQSVTNGAGVFTLSVYAKCSSGTQSFKFIMYNSADGQVDGPVYTVTTEWQRFQHSFTVTQPANWYIANANDSVSRSIYIWGAQLNIGSTAKPYFPTTDRLNVPRLTYQNGGGGCPSLLLEKQSTNLVTYSEQLDNADWLKQQATISANATTSPDGTQNADKLIINNGISGGYVYQLKSTSSGTVYTGSFYVKAGGVGYTKFWTNISGSYEDAVINLSTGAITNSNFAITPTAQSVGNGWYRVVYTTTSGGGQVVVYVDGGSTSTGGTYTGNGTDGIFLWGAQCEASSYATSYIVSTSSSATRVADACFKTGISSLIGQTEGVMFADVNVNITGTAANFAGIAINDGTSSNVIGFGYYQDGRIQAVSFVSGSLVVNINLPSFGLTSGSHKFALAYKLNDYVFYVDGVQVGSDTSASVPATSVFLLSDLVGADISYNEAIIFPTRLTNAELASITSL